MTDVQDVKKAVSTVDLALSAVSLLKSFALIFGVVLIEWARKKQKLAENQAAVAASSLDVKSHQDSLQKEHDEKGADKVISDFLGD